VSLAKRESTFFLATRRGRSARRLALFSFPLNCKDPGRLPKSRRDQPRRRATVLGAARRVDGRETETRGEAFRVARRTAEVRTRRTLVPARAGVVRAAAFARTVVFVARRARVAVVLRAFGLVARATLTVFVARRALGFAIFVVRVVFFRAPVARVAFLAVRVALFVTRVARVRVVDFAAARPLPRVATGFVADLLRDFLRVEPPSPDAAVRESGGAEVVETPGVVARDRTVARRVAEAVVERRCEAARRELGMESAPGVSPPRGLIGPRDIDSRWVE
jgi:hypothetical protein